MDGWWLKAQGDLRFAEPARMAILSNYSKVLDEYCGFTSVPVLAVRWCNGSIEKELGDELLYTSGEQCTFWKKP